MSLAQLDIQELASVITKARKLLAEKQQKVFYQAYLVIVAITSNRSMSVDELISFSRQQGRSRLLQTSLPVSHNHTQTWSGRGRSPLLLGFSLSELYPSV